MTPLKYLTDAPYKCGADDVNVMAFEEAEAIIRGHDVVEAFLSYGIRPLSEGWEFEVERKESPLSKVIVPMPKVIPAIGEREAGETFEAQIVLAVGQLVGNYSSSEHRTCSKELRHGRLNHVFELVGVSYQPRPEPIAHATKKRQAVVAIVMSPPLKKVRGKSEGDPCPVTWTRPPNMRNCCPSPLNQARNLAYRRPRVTLWGSVSARRPWR
jgi:hypothetical protein